MAQISPRCLPQDHPGYRRRSQPKIPVYAKKALCDRFGLVADGTIAVPCAYCGKSGRVTRVDQYVKPRHAHLRPPPTSFYLYSEHEIDHVVPACVGGSDDAENLVFACSSCNASKGACWDGCWLRGRTA